MGRPEQSRPANHCQIINTIDPSLEKLILTDGPSESLCYQDSDAPNRARLFKETGRGAPQSQSDKIVDCQS